MINGALYIICDHIVKFPEQWKFFPKNGYSNYFFGNPEFPAIELYVFTSKNRNSSEGDMKYVRINFKTNEEENNFLIQTIEKWEKAKIIIDEKIREADKMEQIEKMSSDLSKMKDQLDN